MAVRLRSLASLVLAIVAMSIALGVTTTLVCLAARPELL